MLENRSSERRAVGDHTRQENDYDKIFVNLCVSCSNARTYDLDKTRRNVIFGRSSDGSL